MQEANVIGTIYSVVGALIIYILLFRTLKRFFSTHHALSLRPATPYGEYMCNNRGFTECTNVHTRSGQSSVFFDADNWLSETSNLEHAISWITKQILDAQSEAQNGNYTIDGLAFIEKDSGPSGLISMQHLIANQTGMKTCIIRLRRWPFLPQAAIKGEPPAKGSKWIIISDVATTGGHIVKASHVLQGSCWEATIPLAIVLLNRGEDLVEEFSKHGIKLVSDDFINDLFQQRLEQKKAA